MSRLNPFGLPALGRALRSPATVDLPLRMQLAASQRFISSRAYNQVAPRLRAPARNPHAPSPFSQASRRGFRTSAPRRGAKDAPKAGKEEPLTIGARLKKLTREYGWVTVGVYLGLSVLDFPFCFLLVKTAGVDRIGELEHTVVSFIPEPVKVAYGNTRDVVKGLFSRLRCSEPAEVPDDWGVKEAQEASKNAASLVTQLALAYAIHKSFIFLRVPLTAAVTPKVVKVLRGWGWQIGKRKSKA
ncbi:related to protein N-acetyltransferase NAT2 [Cephalotrichum gorgonifer]|uniref:Related to protein N-acetyltransferase NAT2 n=1 Tax=Cephalotrichum gorgonifer TaxID=2041049 RepID=A0AAE8N7H7_9PEZI|nr:related to protein N-acetyltransferase NAT2 [Cephalotrichum gorgonifer]